MRRRSRYSRGNPTQPFFSPPTFRIDRFDDIDSTSSEAFRRAAAGDAGNLWITATRQLAGRGRRGRYWVSEPGNLYASVLLRPAISASIASQLSFVAAVALHEAIVSIAPGAADRLALKWPNDLLLDGAKISGILVESEGSDGVTQVVVVGIGVNCAHHPADTPYPVTDLLSAGFDVAAAALLDALMMSFRQVLALWDSGRGFALVRARWLAAATGVGGPITVRLADKELAGVFEGLGEDGSLSLRLSDGRLHNVAAGEVFLSSLTAGPRDDG